jgi:hypothetical protein
MSLPHRLAPVLLAAFALVPSDLKLKENDHKSLGKLVESYFTARKEEKGIFEAGQKVIDQIESLDKRLRGEKVLASVADLEQAFRFATEGGLKETLKKRGEVAAHKVGELNLAYCLPKKSSKGTLPLLLIACGEGETPTAHLEAHWNDPTLREGMILVAVDLGKDVQSWGLFSSPGSSSPGGTVQLMTALRTIQEQFPIDYNKRFLAGSGKGFAAAETTAACLPFLFAGVIGVGDVAAQDLSNLENFRTLPSLFLKGGEGAKAIETKLTELGYSNAQVLAEGGPAQAWEWIGKNRRAAYPPHITYAPKSDRAGSTQWVSLSGFQVAEQPRVEARADKASNTITIDAQKVANVVVYLNDEIVDLEKPVKFVINGAAHERKVERNPIDMIQNQFNVGDWGRVFTASVTPDIPPQSQPK